MVLRCIQMDVFRDVFRDVFGRVFRNVYRNVFRGVFRILAFGGNDMLTETLIVRWQSLSIRISFHGIELTLDYRLESLEGFLVGWAFFGGLMIRLRLLSVIGRSDGQDRLIAVLAGLYVGRFDLMLVVCDCVVFLDWGYLCILARGVGWFLLIRGWILPFGLDDLGFLELQAFCVADMITGRLVHLRLGFARLLLALLLLCMLVVGWGGFHFLVHRSAQARRINVNVKVEVGVKGRVFCLSTHRIKPCVIGVHGGIY